MSCVICNHEQREEIENALLYREPGDIDNIAIKFGVDKLSLQVHAIAHTSLASEPPMTLVDKIQLKEGEYIRNLILDYQRTMALLGSHVRDLIKKDEVQNITKPTVELYLGLGSEIRQSVDLLSKMNNIINGEEADPFAGLKGLVTALRQSNDNIQ